MRALIGKFLRFIGPHPYNLGQIFLFFWALYLSRYVPLMLQQPAGAVRTGAFILIIFLAIIPAATFAGCAWLWNRFRPWPKNNLGFYLLELLISVVLLNYMFALAFSNPHFETIKGLKATTPPPTPQLQIGSFLVTVFILAALHKTESKIQNRLTTADSLVAELEKDTRLLILAESELKSQVSQFLHDRVQSTLMVISMRLQKIANDKNNSVQSSELADVIENLEALRMKDLRLAINSLAPNFDAMGLVASIQSLIPNGFNETCIHVNLADEADDFSSELKMAIYKISEQAILNSRMHGSAKTVEVSLLEKEKNVWLLKISDDGSGARVQDAQPGLGTAVIDSWTRIIGGTKRVASNEKAGYALEISFTGK